MAKEKKRLFCHTSGGAKSSAIVYSLIQTAIENKLKSQAYLQYIFEQIQMHGSEQVEAILPWSESIPAQCKL